MINKKLSRIVSAILALCTLSAGAVSCTDEKSEPEQSAAVLTSSASDIAANINARLPGLEYELVVGTAADGAAYGIDMADFEDDGYLIRNLDDTVFIFGKTDTALETASNKFVNMYNAGDVADVAYHEGYRIEKLEIFGVDISEYVIEYPESGAGAQAVAASVAVSELQRLVKQATGAILPAFAGDSGEEHVIEFRYSEDSDLRYDGYRYFEEDGTLVIEGASARQGCLTGVYRFLQNECGWDEILFGESELRESDYINIPAGIDKTETPAFDHFYTVGSDWDPFARDQSKYTSTGVISHACHGLQSHNFFELAEMPSQPCYTDDEMYEICLENATKFVAARYGSPSFKALDIAMPDSNDFCFCDTCLEMFIENGNANSAAVVYFANRLSEDIDALYPGLVYQIFAYNDTNKPPTKIVPNEMVHVTYCFDVICSNHPLDGSGCSDEPNLWKRKNSDFAKWFEGWCDITDNIYVWFYSLDTNFHDYTVIDTIYKDFTYLHENGVTGIMYQCTSYGLGMKRIHRSLAHALNWNIDMTEEEYYALYDRLMEKEYGPGWELISEYEQIMQEAQDVIGCATGWGWSYPVQMNNNYYDTFYYASRFDYIVELFDRALAMTETPRQLRRCELLMISALYKGCYSEYFTAYENDDTARIATLSERFDRAMALMKKNGFNLNNELGRYYTVDGTLCQFNYKSIEDAAWLDWYVKWDILRPGHTRPEPDKYVGAQRRPMTYF